MRYTAVVSSVFLTVFLVATAVAQNAVSSGKPEPPAVDLPKGDNAWAVRLVRSGGLSGNSLRDITISSTGEVAIDSGREKRQSSLAPDILKTLGELILTPKDFNAQTEAGGGCFDCYITSITIRRRETNGKDRKYSASWGSATAGKAPPYFAQIAALILNIELGD